MEVILSVKAQNAVWDAGRLDGAMSNLKRRFWRLWNNSILRVSLGMITRNGDNLITKSKRRKVDKVIRQEMEQAYKL